MRDAKRNKEGGMKILSLSQEPSPRERPIPFSAEMVRAILEGRKTQTRRRMKPQPPEGAFAPTFIELSGDICESCGEDFGFSRDKNGGWNAECVHCGYDIYSPRVEPEFIGWQFPISPYGEFRAKCPYGKVGDRLWVKESWAVAKKWDHLPPSKLPQPEIRRGIMSAHYMADGPGEDWCGRIRSPRFMPRWASRLTLEITEVRVQRLREVCLADLWAEGIETDMDRYDESLEARADEARQCYRKFRALWESIHGKGAWDLNPWVWAITFKPIGSNHPEGGPHE